MARPRPGVPRSPDGDRTFTGRCVAHPRPAVAVRRAVRQGPPVKGVELAAWGDAPIGELEPPSTRSCVSRARITPAMSMASTTPLPTLRCPPAGSGVVTSRSWYVRTIPLTCSTSCTFAHMEAAISGTAGSSRSAERSLQGSRPGCTAGGVATGSSRHPPPGPQPDNDPVAARTPLQHLPGAHLVQRRVRTANVDMGQVLAGETAVDASTSTGPVLLIAPAPAPGQQPRRLPDTATTVAERGRTTR